MVIHHHRPSRVLAMAKQSRSYQIHLDCNTSEESKRKQE